MAPGQGGGSHPLRRGRFVDRANRPVRRNPFAGRMGKRRDSFGGSAASGGGSTLMEARAQGPPRCTGVAARLRDPSGLLPKGLTTEIGNAALQLLHCVLLGVFDE
jgi:hypothetical protein